MDDEDEEMFEQWDPYDLLQQLAHDVVMLNDRLSRAEQYLQELVSQHANIAHHLAEQSKEMQEIYLSLGRLLLNETE